MWVKKNGRLAGRPFSLKMIKDLLATETVKPRCSMLYLRPQD